MVVKSSVDIDIFQLDLMYSPNKRISATSYLKSKWLPHFPETYQKFNDLVVQKFAKSRSRATKMNMVPLNAAVMAGSQLTLKESKEVLGHISAKMAKSDERKLMFLQFAFATTCVVFQSDYLGKYAQAHTAQVFKEADQQADVDLDQMAAKK
ncbi:hypothetical protein SARC_03349 [Sphaeroforma arctica JP610]|uniref:Uncharacterized protein n=1 Tax=Sphaeroforma arctica JP610 TaxID=667725 RepID=A0A0L0G6C1_9EUKA|nr:hypothetical protein SARC_03349 [Sphaeroforma arctica JP610]KNC84421.1 hypothetical protein SARC_03349 [Sphaeroforma arctica JP610]|eukprot:XP_014158323.1 hypothetical protein SARC_03349 [Sphaeroforma arctica JP610]